MRDKPRGVWVTSTRNRTVPNRLADGASGGDYLTINQTMDDADEKDEIPVARIPSIEYCARKAEKDVNNQRRQTAMINKPGTTYFYSPTVWHAVLWYFQALTNIMTVDVNFYVGGKCKACWRVRKTMNRVCKIDIC